MSADYQDYGYDSAALTDAHDYLLPKLQQILASLKPAVHESTRIFELGCGNGAVANQLSQAGYKVQGVDYSESGIAQARANFPQLALAVGSVYDDLAARYGRFPLLLSLEVVEHVYFPRKFARTAFDLLEPGGVAIISTPFHGYWKNLALALSGRMDAHFTALWDGGHIKFWSEKTLSALLTEAGFQDIRFVRAGRLAPLAKSMFAIAIKR